MTDIEGSTALLDALGDGYGASCAASGDPRRSVADGRRGGRRAGRRVLRGLRARRGRGGGGGRSSARWRCTVARRVEVRVRAGIHSGRPTLTDDGYIGLSVHTAARVCAVAHGGQIVVTEHARSPGILGAGRAALPQPRPAPAGGTGRSRGAVSGPGRRPRDRLPAAERRLERRAAQSPYGSKVSAPPAPRRSGTARADRSPRRRRPARRRLSGGAPRRPLMLDRGTRARPTHQAAVPAARPPLPVRLPAGPGPRLALSWRRSTVVLLTSYYEPTRGELLADAWPPPGPRRSPAWPSRT